MNKIFDHPRVQAGDVRARRCIALRLNAQRLWRWQPWLVEALASRGHVADVEIVSGPPLPSAVCGLLLLERVVLGLTGDHASDLVEASDFKPGTAFAMSADQPDIVLDLAGGSPCHEADVPWLYPAYDGATEEDALLVALLDGRCPHLSVETSQGCAVDARPAVQDDLVLTRALDSTFSTLLRLCVKAIDEPAPSTMLSSPRQPLRPALSWRALRFAAASAAAKASGRLTKLCTRAPAWSIRWRWAADDDLIGHTQRLPQTGFQTLADDGRRYYADPFVQLVDGVHYLFCEELDYALGKAFISVTTVPQDGRPAAPHAVLEAPHHLSYPFVFEHDGQIWMVPESSGAQTIDLYRADPFPNNWVHEATLLSNIQASDATLFRQKGEWWMFASTVERQSSSWDSLSIFHSRELAGPWIAHPRNPVLIDARAARPAGQLYRSGGQLWRPAQDCNEDYGGALALCTVEQLDHDGFVQTVRARLSVGCPARGPHTLNWAGGLEVIDTFA